MVEEELIPGAGWVAALPLLHYLLEEYKVYALGKVVARRPLWERPAAYQLVGRVMAYQGDDG